MAQIHFGVMFDTETNEFVMADLYEMPVNPEEFVFDKDDDWRAPTVYEQDVEQNGIRLLNTALDNINRKYNRKGE